MAGVYCSGTEELVYGTQNEQENTHNNVIEGDTRREMTVDTDQKYQEKVEAAAKMICKLKQIYQLDIDHAEMAIPYLEEVLHVYSYPLL